MNLAAHISLHSTADFLSWPLDPWIIAGLVVLAALYARGWWVLARRGGWRREMLLRRAGYFLAAMVSLVIALLSPVDGLAEDLFAMHMVQHTLLMLVAAPLLALSRPLPALLLGLPAIARRRIGRGWRESSWLRELWRWVSQPAAAWGWQAGLLWIWHIPEFYQTAIEQPAVHAMEHLCLLGSAFLFWWVALDTFARRRARLGTGILYLLTAMLPGGLLGALLILSPRPWYPLYEGRASAFGLSALADQQLAGDIMGVTGGLVYLLGALLLLKRWVQARSITGLSD